MLSCQETYALIQDYLDRALSPSETELVKLHLDGCGICAEEFVFEGAVLRRIGGFMTEAEVPPELFSRVFSALRIA